MTHDKVAVLDFGGQYAHLIANRVRRLGVYSEILDANTPAAELEKYKGLILSGGPDSVNDPDAPTCDPAVFKLNKPILAICYGHQLMQHVLGGKVEKGKVREYGYAELEVKNDKGLLEKITSSRVWMSHFDMVGKLAKGFEIIGSTKDCKTAAVADFKRQYYGIQFHAEVTHTEQGMKILENFITLTGASRDWTIEQFIKEEIDAIKRKIGDKKVFLLVSGGVDSTVCFALLEEALGKDRVHGMLVDTGLMRLNEAALVKEALAKAGFTNLHVADKRDLFISKLKGISDPEQKRKIIGDLFWDVKENEAKKLGLNPDEWIMGQGTIYPDTIETGGTKHADKIKTHHNRVDLVQQMIAAGKVIEPIAQLYKDEVRNLGEKLGLPANLVWRQPFPGPGLGVRILCTSQQDSEAYQNFSDLNRQIQEKIIGMIPDVKVRVLPIRSVGVQGDERTYKHPVALFTQERDWQKLEKISTSITNSFPDVNRVILALNGSAGEFRLKTAYITEDRVSLLQRADDAVTQVMNQAETDFGIWQFPVVLAPVSTEAEKESVILRPIVSTEAMTASFAKMDTKTLKNLVQAVTHESQISHIFYDLTHKPPGTIEWE